jgi:Ca2+-binding RTX toxin-like protein
MVIRLAQFQPVVLDLNNANDNFGNDADVIVIYDSYGAPGPIATYAGNDVIVLNNFSNSFGSPVNSGTDDDRVFGGQGNDVITVGDGNDVAYGGSGRDEIFAGAGNDVYDGGRGVDILHFGVIGANGGGTGTPNNAAVTCDLADEAIQSFGAFGFDRINSIEDIFGGGGNDQFFGTDGANGIDGRRGNDLIDGRGGNDTLFAFDGSDTLIGGLGADAIVLHEPGGAARDVLRYLSTSDSGTTDSTRDRIANFDKGGLATHDKIDLSPIDGRPGFPGNQVLRFGVQVTTTTSGADTLVTVDNSSEPNDEMTILVQGVTGLTAADFIL